MRDFTNDLRARMFQESRPAALVCDRCGSDFFYAVGLNRYAAEAYSSMAGGDMQVMGAIPHSIRVCPCGKPVVPVISGVRRGAGAAETEELVEAIEGALRIQEKVAGDLAAVSVDLAAVSRGGVTKGQFAELAGRLKALEELVGSRDKAEKTWLEGEEVT
jgi:hypothetical protein